MVNWFAYVYTCLRRIVCLADSLFANILRILLASFSSWTESPVNYKDLLYPEIDVQIHSHTSVKFFLDLLQRPKWLFELCLTLESCSTSVWLEFCIKLASCSISVWLELCIKLASCCTSVWLELCIKLASCSTSMGSEQLFCWVLSASTDPVVSTFSSSCWPAIAWSCHKLHHL